MPQSASIVSPTGRFVYGSLTDKRTIDMDNRAIPTEKQQFEIGVAFRKDDPAVNPMIQAIAGHAWQEYAQFPHIQAIIQQFNFEAHGFSWKISDGDSPNRQGQVNDNTKGCWVLYFKSSFAIKCANQQNADVPATEIKRGFFVRLAFTVAGNGETGERAGIFLNPQVIGLVAYGQEIVGGISAEQAFAGHALPTALPPGASATPVASGPMALPAGQPPAAPPAPAAQPGFPPAGQPAQQPQQASQSTTGFPTNAAPSVNPQFANGPAFPQR